MAAAKRGELKAIISLVILIAIGTVVIVVFYKFTRPEFGQETMSFATGLGQPEAIWYPFVGNMDTQVYYRSNDARVSRIPKDKRVYFADEQTAKKYNYSRAP